MNSAHAALAKSALPLVSGLNKIAAKSSKHLKTAQYPEHETTLQPSVDKEITDEEMEEVIQLGLQGKEKLKEMSLKDKIGMMEQTLQSLYDATEDAVAITAKYKGSYEVGNGEERLAWGVGVALCQELIETHKPMLSGKVRQPVSKSKVNGRVIHQVMPKGLYEHSLWTGYKQEVWFPPGVEAEQVGADSIHETSLVLLLASGNQTAQVTGDILHVVFAENSVCICKLNPVNDYLYEPLLKAFAPIIELGFLHLIKGGIRVSQVLVHAAAIERIHMTGSDKTYDAILWGEITQEFVDSLPSFCAKPKVIESGGDRAGLIKQRKKDNSEMNLSKPFVAELGNITPLIVCPGKWSSSDIDYHARNIVANLVNNSSFNCLALQMLITDARWPQREAFLNAIKKRMDECKPRAAYYPGAFQRRDLFVKEYKDAKIYVKDEEVHESAMPWTMISEVDSETFTRESVAACTEAFSGLFTEMPLKISGEEGVVGFLPEAVRICNDVIWGNLCAAVLIHPSARKKAGDVFEQAIEDLKYGNITINVPTQVGYSLTRGLWGGWGGNNPPTDIQSGNGFVHNSMMYTNPEKSIVRAPFRTPYNPVWMHDNTNLDGTSKKVIKFWKNPNAATFAAVVGQGVRG